MSTTPTLEPYDVLQIERDGRWLDFSTLRDESDFSHARRLVQTGQWDGSVFRFRVMRGAHTSREAVVIATEAR